VSVTFVSCVKRNKDIFKFFSPSGSQAIIEIYALVNLKPQYLVIKNRAVGMLKLTTDKHEASHGLSVTAELLVLDAPLAQTPPILAAKVVSWYATPLTQVVYQI